MEAAPTIAPVEAPEARPPTGRRGRLLIVDDEPALCTTIARILARDHDVTTITSPRQALAIVEEGERFDLILSDLMMPDMTGMELYAGLDEAAPEQAARMIFMSGGTLTADAAKFLHAPGRVSIDKPFRAAGLRELIRNTLDANPDSS